MSNISATAKSKFYVGTTKVCTDAASYSSDTWTEVKSLMDLGEFGDSAEEIKFQTIDDARVRKLKGPRDAGDFTLGCGRDPLDPGQTALKAAVASDFAYNFKVVANDSPNLTGTPSTFYFSGMVMGSPTKFGQANAVVESSFKIAITSAITEVPAVAGV